MMLRNFIIFVTVVGSVVAVAQIVAQRRELASLHGQEHQLRQPATEVAQTTTSVASTPTEQHAPSAELLKLRGEVGQLERRKRELSGARAENEKLRSQLATKGTNAPGGIALPAGYLRKAEAKFMGYDTPENTIQTMLWAIQNRNTTHFVQAFNPEVAKQVETEIQRRGSPEEFFKEAEAMPGLRVTGKEAGEDDTMVLTIEMLPGDEATSQKMRFKQFDGQWKLLSGL